MIALTDNLTKQQSVPVLIDCSRVQKEREKKESNLPSDLQVNAFPVGIKLDLLHKSFCLIIL